MSKRRVKRRRSKALVLMLLPALVFIGLVGWLICAIDPPNKKSLKEYRAPRNEKRDNGVTFMPVVYEDQTEVKSH